MRATMLLNCEPFISKFTKREGGEIGTLNIPHRAALA